MKVLKEWTIPVPWGNIALISFGNPSGENVLLVHGRQDSAATFIPLLELLPDTYHYVAVDMPGNGKSDPFPNGVKIQRFHFLGAMEMVVNSLGWEHFMFIAHSMGCEQGLFYNAVFPGRISRFVLLDVVPTLQRLQVHDPVLYQNMFYDGYYEKYHRDNYQHKLYSVSEAVRAVMKARGLNEQQAELILSRNLIPVGDGKYRLSWDRRLHLPAPQNYPNDYYYELFKNCPQTLVVSATKGSGTVRAGLDGARSLLQRLEQSLEHFQVLHVEGTHDVHFTHPEKFAEHIRTFLEGKCSEKSKL